MLGRPNSWVVGEFGDHAVDAFTGHVVAGHAFVLVHLGAPAHHRGRCREHLGRSGLGAWQRLQVMGNGGQVLVIEILSQELYHFAKARAQGWKQT